MTQKKKVEQLEALVRELNEKVTRLEAGVHHHYHYYQPWTWYVPYQYPYYTYGAIGGINGNLTFTGESSINSNITTNAGLSDTYTTYSNGICGANGLGETNG